MARKIDVGKNKSPGCKTREQSLQQDRAWEATLGDFAETSRPADGAGSGNQHVGDDELIGRLYAAAIGSDNGSTPLDSPPWDGFLQALARRCNAHGATLFQQNYARSSASFMGALGIDAGMMASYAQHYAGHNPWVLAQQGMGPGSVVLSHQLVPGAVLNRNSCYREWLQPQGFDFAIGSNIAVNGHASLKLGVLRHRSAGPMDTTHQALFRRLMPHLQHALGLAGQRQRLAARALAFSALAEHGPCGTLLLAPAAAGHWQVLEMNPQARQIIDARDGLFLGAQRRLQAVEPDDDHRLAELLHQAARDDLPATRQRLGLAIGKRKRAGRYFVEVLRLGNATRPQQQDRAATLLVCIHDPQRQLAVDAQLLEDVLGLTPAEARLAAALGRGLTLRECAAELAIAESTARFVAKRVMHKTGCHRQADLVRLLVPLSR